MTTQEKVNFHTTRASELIDESRNETTLINFHLQLAQINALLLIAEKLDNEQTKVRLYPK
jgi:hypothetical protein